MCFCTGDLVAVDGMSTLAALVRVSEAPEVVLGVSSRIANALACNPRPSERQGVLRSPFVSPMDAENQLRAPVGTGHRHPGIRVSR